MIRHQFRVGARHRSFWLFWLLGTFALAMLYPRAAFAQTGPACGGPVQDKCIVSVTSTNPATPLTLGAFLDFDADTGVFTLNVKNTANADSSELSTADPTTSLTTNSVITVVFKLALGVVPVDPKIAVSTGLISSWTVNTSVSPHEVTFVASPRASSFAGVAAPVDDEPPGGCTPSFCENTADFDYQALLLAAFDPMTPPPGAPPEFTTFVTKFNTGYISTNAQYFDPIPRYNAGAISFFIGAPHLKLLDGPDPGSDPDPNTGFVRVFIPEPVITDPTLWNIAGGSAALEANQSLTRVTVGGSMADFDIDAVTSSGGIALGALVKVGEGLLPILYSVPEIVVRPAAAAAPTLTQISPTSGTIAGGTAVTLTGTGFSGSSVTIGGTAATGVTVVNATTITAVTPAHAAGVVNVVATNSDGQSATLASSYTYVNSTPTITGLGNQSVNEDASLSGLAFTVADADTGASSLTVTASSSNQTLVPNSALVLGGTGANRTLAITPAANQNGTATITLTVSDGSASASTSFTLTVNAVNDAPSVSDIPNQSIAEDTQLAPVTFTIADVDTDVGSLTVTGSASNTTLVPSGAIVLGGSGATRTVSITPAANQYGTTTITIRVSDGALSTSETFELVVTNVNDAPTISSVAAQSGAAGRLVGPVAVTVGDIDSDVAALILSATSGNSAVVAPAGLSVGGSGASRTVTAQTSNATGTAVITLSVSDGSLSASTSFEIVSTHGAPQTLMATADGSLVSLSWSAPTTGGAVSSYRVELGQSAGSTSLTLDAGSSTALAVSTLASGTWFARVRAVGSVGTSPASNEVSFTLSGAPSKPQNFAVSVAGSIVTFTWQAPVAGTVDGYVLEVGSGPGLANLAGAHIGVANMFSVVAPNGAYFARVRARNGAVQSTPSNEVSFSVGGLLTPGAPQNLQVSIAGASIVISWSPPVTGGSPTSYILEVGSAAGLSNLATLTVVSTSFAAAGVPPGTYFVRVRGTNAAGTGPASNEQAFTIGGGPILPPGNPSDLLASVSGSTVILTWSAPTSGGAPTSYTIQAGSAPGLSNLAAVAIGVTTTFTAAGVPSGTYYVRIVATNSAGASGPSNEVTVVVP